MAYQNGPKKLKDILANPPLQKTTMETPEKNKVPEQIPAHYLDDINQRLDALEKTQTTSVVMVLVSRSSDNRNRSWLICLS